VATGTAKGKWRSGPPPPRDLYAHVYPHWGVAVLLPSAPAFLAGRAAALIVCPGFLLGALFFS
ncbi:hypothetical protein, partial [Streptomyces xiamenensis]|uniref:hypothetical protein n=1 Tax=Streptomyces xiamenensis TaxID=408015 RepID=UPI003D7059EA